MFVDVSLMPVKSVFRAVKDFSVASFSFSACAPVERVFLEVVV
jgi:hypothetical protein